MYASDWLDRLTPDLERIGALDPDQVMLIRRCGDLIDQQIPGAEPLWKSCPHARECWRRESAQKPKVMSARIPFIGPAYAARRVAVVAINSRDSGQPGAEIRTTGEVIASLRRGARNYGERSYFHYRVASVVHSALCSLAGGAVDDAPSPSDVAESLLGSARLQAVQCSPTGSARRSPRSAMVRNCPEFLLRGLLEIITPRVLLLFGGPAHQAIERPRMEMVWETTWSQSGNCFSRGRTDFKGRTMVVLAFHHPSTGRWSRSWKAYLTSLRQQPLSIDH